MKPMAWLIMVCFITVGVQAAEKKVVSEEAVIQSMSRHYPAVMAELENVEAASQAAIEAQGAFDFTLRSKADIRTKGFYDGRSVGLQAVKPFAPLNGEVYGGYRVSDGQYPSYEGKIDTLSRGEWNAGLNLSLWRNLGIDSRRLNQWNARLDVQGAEYDLAQTKLEVFRKGLEAYWRWVTATKVLSVYQRLLTIAQARNEALSQRVRKGDLADIYLEENQQYIVRRKAQLLQAERDWQTQTFELSLYLRDDNGQPMILTHEAVPSQRDEFFKITIDQMQEDVAYALNHHPLVQGVEVEMEKRNNVARLGQNLLQPKVDLSVEVSNDVGQGPNELEPMENRAMLQVEIPIERRKGRGKRDQARAEIRALEWQKQLLMDQIKAEFATLVQEMNLMAETIELTEKEMQLAMVLEDAEQERFDRGASDFFVVNLREQNTASAQIGNLKAKLEYEKTWAQYRALSMLWLRP
jgi:outer membrane protein TolC